MKLEIKKPLVGILNRVGVYRYMEDVCSVKDRVTNGAGKVSGLWGVTLSDPSWSQLPVHSHRPRGAPHVLDRLTTTMGYA